MTPELKTACEVVFQEHKTSIKSVLWNKDSFHGRLPFGLSAMAKEILVNKKIIYFPNPEKKTMTALNGAAAAAASVEEAEEMIRKGVPATITSIVEEPRPTYSIQPVRASGKYKNYMLLKITAKPATAIAEIKSYMKPASYRYIIWFACAAIGGAFMTWFLGFIYTWLFL